jgi:hypothetical protein
VEVTNVEAVDWPTTAQAEGRLPNAYKWWTIIAGQTPASFLTMDIFPACANEVIWAGNGSGFAPGNQCTSRNSFDASGVYGTYMVNVACRIFQGKLIGAGTSIGSDKGNASTELKYDHARWQDFAPIRAIILSTNWGTSDYLESVLVDGFRINGAGPGWYDPSYTQHGIVVRMMGETAELGRNYVSDCNGHGVWVNGAGPGKISNLTSFDNNLAGLYLTNDKNGAAAGNSLGRLVIEFLSCDNNGSAQLLSYGGPPVTGIYLKSETGLSNTRGKPFKGTPVIEAHGWVDHIWLSITDAVAGSAGPAFVFESTANRSGFRCLDYTGIAANNSTDVGRSAIIADARSGQVFRPSDQNLGEFNVIDLTWRASGTQTTVTCSEPLTASSFTGKTRLGIATTYAGYNYAAATPVWDPTGGSAPPPAPCTYTYSTWGPCTNGTETRTVVSATPTGCTGTPDLSRPCTITPTCTWVQGSETCGNCSNNSISCTTPYVSSVTGCVPTTAKPADIVRTQTCGTPPPTGSAIDPNDVLVVWNSSDTRTQAWATAYASAWGIPSGNVISVAAGTSHDASTTVATAIRTLTESKGKQYTVLAWEYPSRVGAQSITSLVTFGPRNVSSLTVSPLYNYTGTKPRTDKGVAPSALLVSDKYIRKDADGTRPTGQSILLLANDATGAPRGIARKGQTATGVTVWDNTVLIKRPGKPDFTMGKGLNSCNYISTLCFLDVRRPSTVPILAAYQSMYELGDAGAVVWAKGFYADHVTSVGGYLPGGAAPNYLNSQGQTALTYHLAKGASMSVGSVSEPWQGGDGSLAKQFVNVSIFHPLFLSGKPVGIAAWASVQCPDRALMAGDLLSAPFR